MQHKIAGTAAVVLTLATAAGCGSTAKPLTEAEFAAKGNAICRTVNAEVERQLRSIGAALKAGDRAALLKAQGGGYALLEAGMRKLSALAPPSNLHVAFKRYLGLEQRTLKIEARELARAKQGMPPSTSAHPALANLAHQRFRLREALRLDACTQF